MLIGPKCPKLGLTHPPTPIPTHEWPQEGRNWGPSSGPQWACWDARTSFALYTVTQVVQGVNCPASVPLLIQRMQTFQAAGMLTVPKKGALKCVCASKSMVTLNPTYMCGEGL